MDVHIQKSLMHYTSQKNVLIQEIIARSYNDTPIYNKQWNDKIENSSAREIYSGSENKSWNVAQRPAYRIKSRETIPSYVTPTSKCYIWNENSPHSISLMVSVALWIWGQKWDSSHADVLLNCQGIFLLFRHTFVSRVPLTDNVFYHNNTK